MPNIQYSPDLCAGFYAIGQNFLFRADRACRICQYQALRVIPIAFINRCESLESILLLRQESKELLSNTDRNFVPFIVLKVTAVDWNNFGDRLRNIARFSGYYTRHR